MSFEAACRPWARRILVLDDLDDRPHEADLLVAPVEGRQPDDHAALVPPRCRVLTGASHALLRPCFAATRPAALRRRANEAGVGRILVAFGATDPGDASSLALRAIAASGVRAEVAVLLGGGAPHAAAVRAQAAAMPQPAAVLVDADDVAAQMARADLAIGGGGGMAWERCCLGLPAIIVQIADNQRQIAGALAARGAALDLGPLAGLGADEMATALRSLCADGARLRTMSGAAAAICDGAGITRVLAALAQPVPAAGPVSLRPATADDARRMFVWQTHPSTRRHSFETRPPAWDEHVHWLRGKLADSRCLFRVIIARGRPAGTLRLDRRDVPGLRRAWEVSIVVAPQERGRGTGSAALSLAAALCPDEPLVARVKPENESSERLFLRSGYRPFAPGMFVRLPDTTGSPRASVAECEAWA
jgi:UDP-2,4-diacetamido-2,4,6-trideoxy-beta-L-altropyranose hydrolase